MGTFLDIQTRVKRRLIDLPSQVLAEVPQLVNEAVRHLETQHNFKVMESRLANILTTANTHTLPTAAPADLKEWRVYPTYRTNLGVQRPIIWASDIQAPNITYSDTTFGYPQVLLDAEPDNTGARPLFVWPFPDGLSDYPDGEYRLFLPYYRYLPTLVADADTNWFTVNAEEFIINQATSQGFMLDWDEQRASYWQAQAQQYKKEIIQRDKLLRLSGVNTWTPHWEGARTPNLRF